jgi:hypothetical protein
MKRIRINARIQRRLLKRYFDLAEIFIECLSSVTVRRIFKLQNVNIRNVMKTVANNKITSGGNGDSFKIDVMVSGASTSAIENVIT